jgi:hypothetical protein
VHRTSQHVTVVDGDNHDVTCVTRVNVRTVVSGAALEEDRDDDSVKSR